MTLSDYSHLKQQIILRVGSSERHTNLLVTLKDLFKDEINSPRRFEAIHTIGDLLHILEVRYTLSEDSVLPLKQIVQRLPDCNDLFTKIDQYEATHVPREYYNYYGMEKMQNAYNRELNTSATTSGPNGAISPKKQQRIIQKIVEEIGNDWRDLARYLKIRECVIDDIDNNYKSLARKALRLMEIYLQQKADPDTWFFDLCSSLENARRRDLSKSLTKILMMNI